MESKRGSKKAKSKQTLSKNKKLDESERALTGAGWTFAATSKYLELETDTERMEHLYGMFSITAEQYKFDGKSTATIDFHFANSIFCLEQKFDVYQTQFVCRTFDRILQHCIQQGKTIDESQSQSPEVDKLRSELFDMFKNAFVEFNNNGEYKFSTEQTEEVLQVFSSAIIKPIRLLLYQFNVERRVESIPDLRKVFIPVQPVALSECEEEVPVHEESMEFQPMVIPKTGITLEDAREMIEKYTEGVIATINARYDALDEMISKVQPAASER